MSLEAMGTSLLPSLALVGMLGFRHGFDADHIAVIDGMTRARQLNRSYWTARLVGAQFALGHSLVIMLASAVLYQQSAALPQWLDGLGVAISTCFLLLIAATNFNHACHATDGKPGPMGPVATALFRISGRQLPPALVGVAFAMSFDALAQSAFFASRGHELGGMSVVMMMAGVFGLGMTIADAANGALLSWFAGRSDQLARQASRFSSGFIALIALAAAGAGIARELENGFAQLWENMGVWVGVGLVCFTSVVYMARLSLQKASLQRAAEH